MLFISRIVILFTCNCKKPFRPFESFEFWHFTLIKIKQDQFKRTVQSESGLSPQLDSSHSSMLLLETIMSMFGVTAPPWQDQACGCFHQLKDLFVQRALTKTEQILNTMTTVLISICWWRACDVISDQTDFLMSFSDRNQLFWGGQNHHVP